VRSPTVAVNPYGLIPGRTVDGGSVLRGSVSEADAVAAFGVKIVHTSVVNWSPAGLR